MEIFFSLFNTTGYVFGSAIMVAGLLALGLCLRASLKSRPARAERLALAFSLSPLAIGVCGAVFGLAMLLSAGQLGGAGRETWLALGTVCLAGLVITVPPLTWSLWVTPLAARHGLTTPASHDPPAVRLTVGGRAARLVQTIGHSRSAAGNSSCRPSGVRVEVSSSPPRR